MIKEPIQLWIEVEKIQIFWTEREINCFSESSMQIKEEIKINEITQYFEDQMDASSDMSCIVRRWGRPPKKIDMDSDELWDYLSTILRAKVRRICGNGSEDVRADTLWVRLIRLAKKIPLMLLHRLFPKSQYKSTLMVNYRDAYLSTYKWFHILLLKKACIKKYERALREMSDY